MLVEEPQKPPRLHTTETPRRARAVLFLGVAGACVLGVGAGLWARPGPQERQASAGAAPEAVAPAPPVARKLEIVVDDRPPPPAAPIQVLPASELRPALAAPLAPAASRPPRSEPAAPSRPPEGLIRAHAVTAPAPAAILPANPAAGPAKAAADHRQELARAARAAKARKIAAAKAERAERLKLAAAEAKGRAEARDQARQDALADARKRARLTALAHAVTRALPRRAAPERPPAEIVKVAHKHPHKPEPRVEQASLKSRRPREAAHASPPHAAHVARARPELTAPQPGNGLVKISATSRCARGDPGEAAVCADPGLGAADRQLSRAYQGARAAGVPDAQLRSQQQRWLAARSAAAREAPWAVRDVYMARIAELNGQAKDARDGY